MSSLIHYCCEFFISRYGWGSIENRSIFHRCKSRRKLSTRRGNTHQQGQGVIFCFTTFSYELNTWYSIFKVIHVLRYRHWQVSHIDKPRLPIVKCCAMLYFRIDDSSQLIVPFIGVSWQFQNFLDQFHKCFQVMAKFSNTPQKLKSSLIISSLNSCRKGCEDSWLSWHGSHLWVCIIIIIIIL